MSKPISIVLIAWLLLFSLAAPAIAARITVDCDADASALMSAVAVADDGDRLVVSGRCVGVYDIEQDLTIVAGRGGATLVASSAPAYEYRSLIVVSAGASLRLEHLELRPLGWPAEPAIRNNGDLALVRTTLRGGPTCAIYNVGTVVMRQSTLRDGGGDGDMALTNFGYARLVGSTIAGYSGDHGGGIANLAGTVELLRSRVIDNHGYYEGGIKNRSEMRIINSTIAGNVGGTGVGGVFNSGSMRITNSTIVDNRGAEFGYNAGGVLNTGELVLRNVTIEDNTPTDCVGC